MANEKLKGSALMITGILAAIIYTLGTVVDLFFNTIGNNPYWDSNIWIGGIDFLDWKLFLVLPVVLVVILISFIIMGLGYMNFTNGWEKMFQEFEKGFVVPEGVSEGTFDNESTRSFFENMFQQVPDSPTSE
ncbi:MAG: hypothetical protein ACXAEU_00580 [Candidatus Hodarchaeales archaeon]|jgi:hypothetical protein